MKPRYWWFWVLVSGFILLISPAAGDAAGIKTTIAGGGSHTLAIQRDGSLWAWGYNMHGELGLGDTNWRKTPTRVGPGFVAVASGKDIVDSFSLGLKVNGTLWAWGVNSFGELGLGDIGDQHIPVKVGAATNWVAVAAGIIHSLGLQADGTLWAWGNNTSGQLGLGYVGDQNTPQPVGNGYVAVAAGARGLSRSTICRSSCWAIPSSRSLCWLKMPPTK